MFSFGCSRRAVIPLPLDELNFQVKNDFVYVTGVGELEGGGNFSTAVSQDKASARRAAILDAKRNFLKYLGKARKIKEGSKRYETLSGMVVDGMPVQEEIIRDSQIKVTYRFQLNGEKGLSEILGVKEIKVRRE